MLLKGTLLSADISDVTLYTDKHVNKKITYNFCPWHLTDDRVSTLGKRLKLALPPKKVNDTDIKNSTRLN